MSDVLGHSAQMSDAAAVAERELLVAVVRETCASWRR